jgi:hypothetical protein
MLFFLFAVILFYIVDVFVNIRDGKKENPRPGR